jgi:hypothetical protein
LILITLCDSGATDPSDPDQRQHNVVMRRERLSYSGFAFDD